MKSFTKETAERYSLALYELSNEKSEQLEVEQSVKNVISILDHDKQIKNYLINPTKTSENQINLVKKISEIIKAPLLLKNFLFLLIKKRRIFFAENILKQYIKLSSEKRGEIVASLVSSKKISEDEIAKITKEFSDLIGSSINLNFKVDETLIGGLKLQVGSLLIDSSVKNKLKNLKQSILEN
jgi:F-type H+-transporting ATPase subunit delta